MHNRCPASGRWPTIALILAVICGTPTTAAAGAFATTDDGVKIYYDTTGTGIPVFLIAGGPGSNTSRFRYTHALLQCCGKLVYLDNRGRGRSEDVGQRPQAYTLENDLKDVEAVRKAIGAERIVICGHSYGSMVAMAYAARFPQRTAGLMTSAGVHGARAWQERNIDGVKRFLKHHYPKRWARIVKLHFDGELSSEGELAELFRGIGDLYDHHPESVRRWEAQFEEYHDTASTRYNPDVYTMMVGKDPEWTIDGTLKNVELLPELKDYSGPALIMGGRFDRLCPPSSQHEIADVLPNAKLVIFEQSGHSPFLEEPLRFLTVVGDFLREIAPAGK